MKDEVLDVLVIAQYSGDSSGSNNRFREIAAGLEVRGVVTELITSSFLHSKKIHAHFSDDSSTSFKIVRIDEPGYLKNVSLRRIWSHRRLGSNLEKYLNGRKVPDLIYCAVPSPNVAAIAAKFARRKGVRLILDVQDLWPEAFEMVLKPKPLARLVLSPLRKNVERVYASADEVVTVSETYSNRVRAVRREKSSVETVYLGTKLETFDQYPAKPWDERDSALQLVYIGTLGHSYDLPLVFRSLRILKDRQIRFKLHIMGSGPLEVRWRELSRDLSDHVCFHGRLPYPEMVSRLKSSDIAINPIVPGAAGSIINKVCDYAAAGLPVVNTQDNDEYRQLLVDFEAGINCDPSADSLAEAIVTLNSETELRRRMSEGARKLAVEHFDRAVSYQRIFEIILR